MFDMKKILVLIATALLCLSLAGCGVEFTESQYNSDSIIAQKGDNGLSKMSVMSTKNKNEVSFSVQEFKGTKTLWTMDYIKGGETAVDVTFTLKAGKAKLVHIDSDGKVETIAECTPDSGIERSTGYIINLSKGRNRIKLVGIDVEDLKVEFTVG